MPHFQYTTPLHTCYAIRMGADTTIEVVGDEHAGCYEWQLRVGDTIEAHSDDGYRQPRTALREGLMAMAAWRSATPLRPPQAPLARFRYTRPRHTYYAIGIGFGDATVEVVGDGDNACYEWQIRIGDTIEASSNAGYGIAEAALRDGLIEYLR